MTDTTIDVAALVERLNHAATTAANDDLSEPMSDQRRRHAERFAAMVDAATAIQAQADALAEARRENIRLSKLLRDDPKTILIAHEDGDHKRLSRAAAKAEARATTAEASLATMREALEELVDTLTPASYPAMKDPAHHDDIKRLGDRIGYGALMAGASAAWREVTPHKGSEFVAGPCYSVLKADYDRAVAALAKEGK